MVCPRRGDYVTAVVLVAVAVVLVIDGGGVAVQLLVVKDDGWAEQGGPSLGTLRLFNNFSTLPTAEESFILPL